MSHDTTVKLTGVDKSYLEGGRSRAVLRDVNAEFPSSRFIVIQGRSGSGKTTLLNLMGGLDLPDRGEIRVDGRIINRLDEDQRTRLRRRRIGFVFQFIHLIPTLTVAENLAFPLELNGVDADAAQARIEAMLAEFALPDRMRAFPDQLSGGEQQRVAIARAVIHRPALVLADEPTGNLDRATEREVLAVLGRLPADYAVTVVCATHSPEVASCADAVYHLDGGAMRRV
jgi:putative ABC transport system ATP-binding protein